MSRPQKLSCCNGIFYSNKTAGNFVFVFIAERVSLSFCCFSVIFMYTEIDIMALYVVTRAVALQLKNLSRLLDQFTVEISYSAVPINS